MPEPTTPPVETTPAAPTAPANNTPTTPAKPETYGVDGKVEGVEDAFLSEDETTTELPVEEGEQAPTQPQTPPEDQTPTETVEEKEAREIQEAADAKAEADRQAKETTETGKEKPGDEKLLAGKYKTKEELEAGFRELGGDPTKYTTPEALEEAYSVRNAEFTRVRQESEESARIAREAEQRRIAEQTAADQTPEKISENIIKALEPNFPQMNDVADMVKFLVPALLANLPKPQANLNEAELAAKLEPQIRERGEKIQALATLEAEVPRLKSDPVFRKGFAAHLLAGNYQRNSAGLKQAMQEFLDLARSVAGEVKTQAEKDAAAKVAATGAPDGGTPVTTTPNKGTPEDNILEDIVGAYKDHEARSSGNY